MFPLSGFAVRKVQFGSRSDLRAAENIPISKTGIFRGLAGAYNPPGKVHD